MLFMHLIGLGTTLIVKLNNIILGRVNKCTIRS